MNSVVTEHIGNMRAVCEVRGLTLLLQVGTLWRFSDGLLFEVPPLASNALLKMLHPLLKNLLQIVDHFEISCFGAPFSSSCSLFLMPFSGIGFFLFTLLILLDIW
jgi:hypothetical protein